MTTNAERIMKAALQIKARIQKDNAKIEACRTLQQSNIGGEQFQFIPMEKNWITGAMSEKEIFDDLFGRSITPTKKMFKALANITLKQVRDRSMAVWNKRHIMIGERRYEDIFRETVSKDTMEMLNQIRVFYFDNDASDLYENHVDTLCERAKDTEYQILHLNDTDDNGFANLLKTWVVLQFDITKYRKLQHLADAANRSPGKAYGYRGVSPLYNFFESTFNILDFCHAVGGLNKEVALVGLKE
jgi:hypothetical protein